MRNLTVKQVKERLQFLRKKYPNYSVWVNTSDEFNPLPIAGKREFFIDETLHYYGPRGGNSDSTHYGYVVPHRYERVLAIRVQEEYESLCELYNSKLNNLALIVHDTNIMGVYGLFVDHTNKRVVLLNSNYNNEIVDWSEKSTDTM